MSEKLLEVRNLNVRLKKSGETLVKDISFSMEKGQTLGIIGESGSGKTMTGKALLRLLNPRVFETGGEALFCGRNLLALHEDEFRSLRGKALSMIMQNPMTAFAPMTRIGKQLTVTLSAHLAIGKKEAYERALRALRDVNLHQAEKIMRSYPHELSGGMLQRAMIALALMLRPKLIIADEATSSVDAISEEMILEEFMKIRAQGISLLIVTHDFGVAAALADHILVMKDGCIMEQGTARSIFHAPRHEYTKELMDASVLAEVNNHAQSF
ncbi:nickel transport system ATP-binding protein [Sporobacter termitidis DSM 10068]|uniref:Nickel transport system ATP-binding protein n=1 Tax=Sporobacter termitidis DSM 10068 TaxID=1123282 RepID=A0A1M5YS44_9FIRM|nr:ABC transporter ATP-binding protein [Sporobacter termitidis]SHI14852.1 nickel transport system ATP-binding protein [Sporobacter termitidis DSM 10068]